MVQCKMHPGLTDQIVIIGLFPKAFFMSKVKKLLRVFDLFIANLQQGKKVKSYFHCRPHGL